MSAAPHKCEGRVWSGGYHPHACGVNAKFEHEGHWYCKTHHPPSVKAKTDARDAQWAAERAEKRAAHEKAAAARDEMERRAGLYDELLGQCVKALAAWEGSGPAIDLDGLRAVIAKAQS